MADLFSLDHFSIGSGIVDLNKLDKFYDISKRRATTDGVSSDEVSTALRIDLDATRSGSIVNRRMYRGPSVQKNYLRFTEPYDKPVLKGHDQENPDATIGRVVKSRFEKFEKDAKKFKYDFAYATKKGEGSGRVILTTDITDEDAQQRVIDGRYATVSTSQQLAFPICSHCGRDWSLSQECEHWPGRKAELTDDSPLVKIGTHKKGKALDMFLITDVIDYFEVSFVPVPAQEKAKVLNFKKIADELGVKNASFDALKDIMISRHYVSPVNAIRGMVMSDSLKVQESLLIDDVEDEVNQTTTGKTTVQIDMPAVEEDEATGDNDSNESTPEEKAQDAKENINNVSQEKSMGEQTKTQDNAQDTALEIVNRENKKLVDEKAELQVKLDKADEEKESLQKKLDDSKAEVIGLIADQLYLMRKITGHASISELEGKDEAETKANIDAYKQKLATRTMDSLRDAVEDEKADFEQKIADLEKFSESNVDKSTVDDPTLSDTSKDDKSERKEDKADSENKDVKDVL